MCAHPKTGEQPDRNLHKAPRPLLEAESPLQGSTEILVLRQEEATTPWWPGGTHTARQE